MIISASRRTDIPAFYADWFANRIKAGFCSVPNPFNKKQVSKISLKPEDVDGIVFWTRYALPLLTYLPFIDSFGFNYSFLYTLVDYPRVLDRYSPSFSSKCEVMLSTAAAAPGRVIWRYDPIYPCEALNADYHISRFGYIANILKGYVTRVVISLMDPYAKTQKNLGQISDRSFEAYQDERLKNATEHMIPEFVAIAAANGMTIQSCAEKVDMRKFGVESGACIDGKWLQQIFGAQFPSRKAAGQRALCMCTESRDIGMYDSCVFGCRYCYAVSNHKNALAKHGAHDPLSESLLPVAGST